MTDLPRLLMVGTVPYDPNESSRALDTYFHDWPKDKLRMIFSNANIPMKWNYESLYQITDYDVLSVLRKKAKVAGRILNYCDLKEESIKDTSNKLSKFKKKNFFRYYARYFLWRRKRWLSQEMLNWVDEYKPEAIYICFSDDYFILDIACYFSDKYNIPVIAQIGDDYYFKKNKNPLLVPYLHKYKKIFDKIMNKKGFGVYISDKLADKYNCYFKLKGYPFYLFSGVVSGESKIKHEFNYIGKVELGRYRSLGLLADSLNEINGYKVNVYSQKPSNKILEYFKKHNCDYKGEIPYAKAKSIMNSGSFNIVASGFKRKDIEQSRYSLSTKVSDSLASSGPIIVVGPEGDGAVDFFKNKDCSICLTSKKINISQLKKILNNDEKLYKYIKNAHLVSKDLFDPFKNRESFIKHCLELK